MENGKQPNQERLLSLDALRGFDMMFIMGLSGIIVSLCCLFPDGDKSWLATQMSHVSWHGFRHHDTIFALFLFISGMSFPYSLAKKQSKGWSRGRICLDIFRRGMVLFLLGLVYQGVLNFNFADLRIPSVLGRIGIAWMFAAFLYANTGKKVQWITAGAILIGYFLLLRLVQAPDAPTGAGPFSFEGNLAGWVDRVLLPNHIYSKGVYDPEGILSTLPSIVTALFGMFTGRYVKESDDSGCRKTVKMLAAGVVMLVAALVWNNWFPINKKLWTSTFVLAAGSYSLIMFAIFYYIFDVRKWRRWAVFFQVVGMNSITIYLAQRIISFSGINKFFFSGLAGLFPENAAKLVLDLGYFSVCWFFLYFLYKKKVFLKV